VIDLVELSGIPADLLSTVQDAARASGVTRLALVGGAVRDALLHHQYQDPWRGLPDLDLVFEGSAEALARHLLHRCGAERVSELRVHGNYGTVELTLDGVRLDLAAARKEHYPAPGVNPVVEEGLLELDLARRDFTVNALALELPLNAVSPQRSVHQRLLDLHGGQDHLARRQLAFLHGTSVADDPTRVVRAARYGARLDFSLAPDAAKQITDTLEVWPWKWHVGDPPEQAPPALATRLRMELELLLAREPWPQALKLLQAWRGLELLDPGLQSDGRILRRLGQAQRLGLPLLTALVAGAADPIALAARLQLPLQQQRVLQQQHCLLAWLAEVRPEQVSAWSAADWTQALERQGWAPEAVAHAVCVLAQQAADGALWKPLLRWWGRWRHLQAAVTAKDLMAQGWKPGPALGEELRRLRWQRLEQLQ